MARRKRESALFGLAFLDAMTCGLGAVILLYMLINGSVRLRAEETTVDLTAEADRLEVQVLDGARNLVELRNTLRAIERENTLAQGLSRRLLEMLEEIRAELATFEADTLAKNEHVNKLKSDLETLEEEAKRLSAQAPSEEVPGDRVRSFVGHGDRQYLTGLKVGGGRVLVLVDTSSSMLDKTLVNILRRRNLPPEERRKARKWQQAVQTVDWLTAQLPRRSHYQIYTFSETAAPLLDGTAGTWLDGEDRAQLDLAAATLRDIVPDGGTSLHQAFRTIRELRPEPDNIILVTDGLPTQGARAPRGGKVSGKERLAHFQSAIGELPNNVPINTILLPMEGDPLAASSFWRLAVTTRGSFLAPAEDWP